MPLIATRGAASAQGFGEFAQTGPVNYIEDVFSTYLYTGNGSTQTITNNIDLSGKGGLVWIKARSAGYLSHVLTDTARGNTKILYSNLTAPQDTFTDGITSFGGSGFSVGASAYFNQSTDTYASWTFRKQPKFFDVVTYTGNGAASRNISHSLGSKPGFVVIKRTDSTGNWFVAAWTGTTFYIGTDAAPFALNLTNGYNLQNSAAATATTFDPNEVTISSNYGVTPSNANINGATYVAYLFAHNAGGFGDAGSDNVISCGSYTGNGSTTGPTVTLGYEPQWLLIKRASGGTGNWVLIDSMRGFVNSTTASPSDAYLVPNTTAAEQTWGDFTGTSNAAIPLATGFQIVTSAATLNNNTDTYIYIAIRRGPMKTPTSGTSVFSPNISSGSVGTVITTNFPVDMQINSVRNITSDKNVVDRLRGVITTPTDTLAARLRTNLTNAESDSFYSRGWNNTGFQMPATIADASNVFWSFRRAPGFFDVVCYTGTGSARTVSHNLGVVPELMIVKNRSDALDWAVYSAATGNAQGLNLNVNVIVSSVNWWDSTTPTSTTFRVSSDSIVNGNGQNLVAYLFATSPGVSKVGSYSGNGTDRVINCGFTTGARFVLIKCTSNTGNWTVWDSARGITSGNDPLIALNLTSSENPNTDFVNTDSTGFYLTTNAVTGFNEIGRSYLFLAIA